MRHHAAVIALAAILLRAFIPAGWMPHAGTVLAFCTADGLVLLDSPAGDPAAPPEDHPSVVCPFAHAAGTALASAPAISQTHTFPPAPPAVWHEVPTSRLAGVGPGTRLSRAPPA